jgi:hypothetical protein
MKAMICALALAGLFTSQAHASISNMSCGQLADAKAVTVAKLKTVGAKIKDARNSDKIEALKNEKEALTDLFLDLDSEIKDRCMGDDYND